MITPDEAEKDLLKVKEVFKTADSGSDLDRIAQLVIQSIQVLKNRLEEKELLKILYIENEVARNLLPGIVQKTVQKLYQGEIKADEADQILDEALTQYKEAFLQMAVSPTKIEALFIKEG